MQRYFLPCNQKYNLHLTEYISLITVEVTEPLRFFFCRFLSDYAAGLYLVFVVVLRPLHLDFNISKIQIGGKKNGIQQRTGEQEMAYLERIRGKNIAGTWR